MSADLEEKQTKQKSARRRTKWRLPHEEAGLVWNFPKEVGQKRDVKEHRVYSDCGNEESAETERRCPAECASRGETVRRVRPPPTRRVFAHCSESYDAGVALRCV